MYEVIEVYIFYFFFFTVFVLLDTGGQAKTLMLVQLNPEAISYSESLSTLTFAERVSGVELGPLGVVKRTVMLII